MLRRYIPIVFVIPFFCGVQNATAQASAPTAAPKLPYTLSEETTAITRPLKSDGTVDYVAAVNERYGAGVTPENNGFVLYLRVMGPDGIPQSIRPQMLALCGAAATFDPTEAWKTADALTAPASFPFTEIDEAREHLWKTQDHPKLAEYLKSQEKPLSLVLQAANKPRWWAPAVSTSGALNSVLLPQLNSLHDVAQCLCARAMLHAGEGDFDAFLADIIAVKKLANHTSGSAFLIGRLVASNLDILANNSIGAAVGSGVFSAAQCDQLAKALDGIGPLSGLTEAVDFDERWGQLDFVSLAATGKLELLRTGNSFNDVDINQLAGIDRQAVDWDSVLTQLNKTLDETLAIIKNPALANIIDMRRALDEKVQKITANQPDAAHLANATGKSKADYSEQIARLIRRTLTPSFGHVQATIQKAQMIDDMTRTLIAAARYRGEIGKWPESLEALTPKYLPTPFKDRYSRGGNESFRSIAGEKAMLVYSIGPNGTDDGGIHDNKAGQDDIGVGVNPNVEGAGL